MTKTTISISSIFLIVLAASGFTYWNTNKLDNKVHHYINQVDLSLYEHRGIVNTNAEDQQAQLIAGITQVDQRYKKGQSIEALAAYQHLLEKDPSNMELLLRIGIIYLQENDYEIAQEYLNEVYGFKESIFALDAAWFLALIQAKYKNIDQMKVLLKQVVAGRGNYYLNAEALLKECD